MGLPGKASLLDTTKRLALPSKVRRAACRLPRIQHALSFLGVASSFGCCTSRLAQNTQKTVTFVPHKDVAGCFGPVLHSKLLPLRSVRRQRHGTTAHVPGPTPPGSSATYVKTKRAWGGFCMKIPSKFLFSETGSINSPFRFRALTVPATLFCFSTKATAVL